MVEDHLKDTIAAIATPLGTGGVGAIRVSGEKSLQILSRIFSPDLEQGDLPEFKGNRIYHGWITENNNPIDEVIILVFKAPKSYTGEDVVEIQCHGGVYLVRKILEICINEGARLAQNGEFTKRAFLNGRLDLSKAEAVLDIIHSKTDKFSKASAFNLSGKLSAFINDLRSELINLLSIINASIDFPEEVDEPEYSYICSKISEFIGKIDNILKSAKSSNLMRQGVKIALAGKPNVGKSSLFNVLLSMERSIVTEVPGTTRDIIQESVDIGGIPVTLVDTAGIREFENHDKHSQIELIGINLAKSSIKEANIVLFMFDSTQGIKEEDQAIFDSLQGKKIIKIASKCDLGDKIPDNSIKISSKTMEGIDNLKKEMEKEIFAHNIFGESEFFTNLRQQECLERAENYLLHSIKSCKEKADLDFICIDLKSALISLGEITGEVVTDEILENIFSSFCIGK